MAVIAAIVLSLGAVGAVVAVETGQKEKRDEIAVPEGKGKSVLRSHERDGEMARNLSVVAAAFAVAACYVGRVRPSARWIFAVAAAICSLLTAARVAETGRSGGELVYHHGVGLRF